MAEIAAAAGAATAHAPDQAATETTVWHGLTAQEASAQLQVEPRTGLDPAEVERLRAEVGPNKLAEAKTEPGWRAFLRQYRDLMQLVLLGAAIVSIVALQEFSTGVVIIGLTVLNAILGLNQEGKAAESVAALQKMLVIKAHARRGGEAVDIPAEELVPGDVVSFEAGDRSRRTAACSWLRRSRSRRPRSPARARPSASPWRPSPATRCRSATA